MTKRDENLLGCIVILVTYPLALILVSILNGWVLSIMWTWFIVPKFNAPTLNIPEAIFIGLIVSFLTYRYNTQANESENTNKAMERYLVGVIMSVIHPLIALAIACVTVQFLPVY